MGKMRAHQMTSLVTASHFLGSAVGEGRAPAAGKATVAAVGEATPAALGKWTAACFLIAAVMLLRTVCTAQSLLSGPQKIVIDAAHDRLLVSNYNTGAIVAIDNAGNQSYFVQAATFIDGMEIVGNTVYGAASGRRVKGYDLDTATQTMSVAIAGTGYLSSLAADNSGYLCISCPLRNEIYKMRLSDYSYWTFVGSGSLNKPNGMLFQEAANRLVVIEDRANPRILAVNLADSTVTQLAATTLAGGDGIEQDTAGNYYVTGYYLPGVYKFDSAFSQPPEMIYPGTAIVYPTYDASDNSLLVTCYDTNDWARIPLGPSSVRAPEDLKSGLLFQTYPNPFGPKTTIRFELGAPARTQLDVHDVSGSVVRTLMDEAKSPGNYSLAWDGRDDSGRQVACGTYYCRLKVNGRARTRKAIVARLIPSSEPGCAPAGLSEPPCSDIDLPNPRRCLTVRADSAWRSRPPLATASAQAYPYSSDLS
jgi:hypothetical protein